MTDVWQAIVAWCDQHNAEYLLIAAVSAAAVIGIVQQIVIKPLRGELDQSHSREMDLITAMERFTASFDGLSQSVADMAKSIAETRGQMSGMLEAFRSVVSIAETSGRHVPDVPDTNAAS